MKNSLTKKYTFEVGICLFSGEKYEYTHEVIIIFVVDSVKTPLQVFSAFQLVLHGSSICSNRLDDAYPPTNSFYYKVLC